MKKLAMSASLLSCLTFSAFAQDASTVVATVNGTQITLGHVIAMEQRLPDQFRQLPDAVLFNGMIEQLIQQEVLAASAREKLSNGQALGLENEARAFLAGVLIDDVANAPVDEADIKAAFDARYADAEVQTEWNASHILVASEEEAESLVTQLNEGADFAELAKTYSTGPSGPNGGELGWFGAGMMVPSFEEAVRGLEAEGISAPVQTQFGWHVVKLNEMRERGAPDLAAVRDELEQEIKTKRVDDLMNGLTEAADVTRADISGITPAIIRDGSILGTQK